MEHQSFVTSAMFVLVTSSVTVGVFRQFGLGSVFGLLIAGVFIGPYTPGPKVTDDVEHLRHFTELGVVLLLFLIGLEIKPRRLWSMRKEMFGIGTTQIVLSALFITAYANFVIYSWKAALIFGLALAMSSTALVMQMLQERGEVHSQHGQIGFAILLMQDLAIIPLLALVPILAESNSLHNAISFWQELGLILLIFSMLIIGSYIIIRPVLDYLAHQHNREGFFLVILAAVFVAAWAMEQVGLSMALGAFLIGMTLSNSRYHYYIQSSIEPHKGLLMSLFFVAVGMSINIGALAEKSALFALHVTSVLIIKILVLLGVGLLFGIGRSITVHLAFLLAQSGEFGFVLFGSAKALNVIDEDTFVMGIGIVSITMLLTQFLVSIGNWIVAKLERYTSGTDNKNPIPAQFDTTRIRTVVVGYGRMGHAVGTILTESGIPFIAIDLDPVRVAYWQEQGHPVYYGDIGNVYLLGFLHLERLDLVIMALQDSRTTVRATYLIRNIAPLLPILARASDLAACDELIQAGVTRALPETLEASLRLAAESLEVLGIATGDADKLIKGVRKKDYDLLRDGLEIGIDKLS